MTMPDALRIALRLDLTPGGVVSAEDAALLVVAIQHQVAQLAAVVEERDAARRTVTAARAIVENAAHVDLALVLAMLRDALPADDAATEGGGDGDCVDGGGSGAAGAPGRVRDGGAVGIVVLDAERVLGGGATGANRPSRRRLHR